MNKSVDEEAEDKWNNRYQEGHYAYGKGPNLFFKEWLYKFKPGSILMPADGEGRNDVFLEAFSKKHLHLHNLDPKVGGPKDIDMLFSKAEISVDFENYDSLILEQEDVFLNEGEYHIGKSAVVRFVGRKSY